MAAQERLAQQARQRAEEPRVGESRRGLLTWKENAKGRCEEQRHRSGDEVHRAPAEVRTDEAAHGA